MKIILSLIVIYVLFAISCDSTTEPSAKPMIYGTFVDADGNPIADAEICLIPHIATKYMIGKAAIMDAPKPPMLQVVELEYFTASRIDENVELQWATSSEQNCDRFELMRAVMQDNKPGTYTKIATVQAKGISATTTTYSFTDENLEAINTYYYKLKIIDKDGSSVETDVVKFKYLKIITQLRANSPNPFTIVTAFYYSLPKSSDINFNIVEKNTGIKYVDLNIHASSGSHMYRWLALLDPANNDSTHLRPGIYIANLTTQDTTMSTNLVLDFWFKESNCEIPLQIVKTDKNGKFEIDWKWIPELAEYPRVAADGSVLGKFMYGDSGEIIGRKFVSENDNTKKYLIGRHSFIADRNGELKITLTAKEIEVQK
ncbi:MAG: hypothetical protein CVV22_00415 [Ignavibacteriae bacterium HGW-Ignavibacteriae-1]|jgi:hypothetical protein|nr:MAG: hypothetical protein CVV22_00415 [Ignavibacteriae bacterium HGW-Ignavibacteriae-1]